MRRLLTALLPLAVLSLGACIVRPPSPPQGDPTFSLTAYVTNEATGAPLVGATAYSDAPGLVPETYMGPPTASASWLVRHAGFNLCATLTNFLTRCLPVADPVPQTLTIPLTPSIPPPPPVVRPSAADLWPIRANMANLTDSHGWVIWTSSLPGANDATWREWLTTLAAKGSTHLLLSPSFYGPAYSLSPPELVNPDTWNNLALFRQFVERALDTASADGKGFRVIINIGEDDYRGKTQEQRWTELAAALSGLEDSLLVTPCSECVVGSWSSRQYSDALFMLHRVMPKAHIVSWLSPTRGSWGSNPPEADDPLYDGTEVCERCAWLAPYDFIEGFLYQTEHKGDGLLNGCQETTAPCWLGRWWDQVARFGAGRNGWRVMHVALFETVAMDYFRQDATGEDATRIARDGKKVCDDLGVVCGFGNGLP